MMRRFGFVTVCVYVHVGARAVFVRVNVYFFRRKKLAEGIKPEQNKHNAYNCFEPPLDSSGRSAPSEILPDARDDE